MLRKQIPKPLKKALTASGLFSASEIEDVSFKRFDGGYHNDIYRVRLEKKDYAVRVSKKPNKRDGYFREEFHNHRIAADAKIAPNILYADENNGTLIYPYLKGSVVTRDDVSNPTFCGRVTRQIKAVHSLDRDFLYEHSFLRSIERREQRVYGHNLEKCPEGTKKLAIVANRAMELIQANPVPQTPCHADLILDNMIKTDDNQIYLIDWELSGMSDPHEDLANFICFGNLNQRAINMILLQYFDSIHDLGASRTYLFIIIILYYWILRHAEDLLKFPDDERLLHKQQRRLLEAYEILNGEDYKRAVIALKRNQGKEYEPRKSAEGSSRRKNIIKRSAVDKEPKSTNSEPS